MRCNALTLGCDSACLGLICVRTNSSYMKKKKHCKGRLNKQSEKTLEKLHTSMMNISENTILQT